MGDATALMPARLSRRVLARALVAVGIALGVAGSAPLSPAAAGEFVDLEPTCTPGTGFDPLGPFDPNWDKASAMLYAESAFGRPYTETRSSSWFLPWCSEGPAEGEGVDCSSYVAKAFQLPGPIPAAEPYDRSPYLTNTIFYGTTKTMGEIDIADYTSRPEDLLMTNFVIQSQAGGNMDHTGAIVGYRKSKGLYYTYESRSQAWGIGPGLWLRSSNPGVRFFARHEWASAPTPVVTARNSTGLAQGIAPDPEGLTVGPDGDVWFVRTNANRIQRITPKGKFASSYPIPTANSGPRSITTGPDGAMWFTEMTGSRIGRITTDGDVSEFELSNPASMPFDITTGPEGAMWFTYARPGVGGIARITTSGEITEFDLPDDGALPSGISTGPDGRIWITYLSGDDPTGVIGHIARFDTSGNRAVEIDLPAGIGAGSIVEGPDRAMWFAAINTNAVGKVTGQEVELFDVSTENSSMSDIALGSDGRLWATVNAPNNAGQIAAVTGAGDVSLFKLPETAGNNFFGFGDIIAGPDEELWFSEDVNGLIGSATTDGSIMTYLIPT